MKIALFIGNIKPTDGGGYTYVTELLRALGQCQSDHKFVLCHLACVDVAKIFPEFSKIDLNARKASVLSLRERFFQHFPEIVDRVYRWLFRLAKKPRWDDRIYIQEGIQFVLRLVPWIPATNDIPFGTIVWDLQHRTNPYFPELSNLQNWQDREENFSLLRRASIVYTSTYEGRREIESYYQVPTNRIKIVPYPTPSFAVASSSLKHSDLLRRLSVPKDYLFYPAQFWAHKNHVVILEACKLVRDRTGWNLGVVFTGADKENGEYVSEYALQLGLENNCRFLNFVDQSDLVELYKGAFCLVYPTFFGPDNLPPLEAFALGCPVIASDVPGASEQLGDAALLFPPVDESLLADHIIKLRDNSVRARMIAAGLQRTRDGTTWNSYAVNVIQSLDEFAKIRRTWP